MEKIKSFLKGLIDDKSTPEFAEQVGAILNEYEREEKEKQELIASHEELRSKYVKSIQENSFKGNPKEEEEIKQPRTLEQIIKDVKGEK